MGSLSKRAPAVQVLLMICACVAFAESALQSLSEVRPSSASQKP
jgi:hypothetical protein